MIRIRGQKIILRPIRPDELDILADAYDRPETPAAVRPTRTRLKQRIEQSGRLRGGRLELGIEAGGRLVGDVDARAPASAYPPGVFEVGITIFDPADRGRGYGLEAIRLVVDHLFDAEEAARVQATTDERNAAMRTVLERAGFRREGTLRGFFPTAAGRADYALYGITRADWLETAAAAAEGESVVDD